MFYGIAAVRPWSRKKLGAEVSGENVSASASASAAQLNSFFASTTFNDVKQSKQICQNISKSQLFSLRGRPHMKMAL